MYDTAFIVPGAAKNRNTQYDTGSHQGNMQQNNIKKLS